MSKLKLTPTPKSESQKKKMENKTEPAERTCPPEWPLHQSMRIKIKLPVPFAVGVDHVPGWNQRSGQTWSSVWLLLLLRVLWKLWTKNKFCFARWEKQRLMFLCCFYYDLHFITFNYLQYTQHRESTNHRLPDSGQTVCLRAVGSIPMAGWLDWF